MFKILRERLRQGKRTVSFPEGEAVLPARFRGLPVTDAGRCKEGCRKCMEICPTGAVIKVGTKDLKIDMGKCLFCGKCARVCPECVIEFSADYRLASGERRNLVTDGRNLEVARALDKEARRIFGRSLKLRQVSAGGCNGCEMDINVLSTVVFDLARFGIQFVASPRHADGLVITGPVTRNMVEALKKTYDAVPSPKIVISVGACAISGGPFESHRETEGGVDPVLPVDLYIPGCPPHPYTILDGLLRVLGRIPADRKSV